MSYDPQRRQAMLAWLFVGMLFLLCGALGVLQYRWIGEVSIAARERMQASLQASLERVSRDFQSDLVSACRSIAPEDSAANAKQLSSDVTARYQSWKSANHQGQLFRGVALVTREGEDLNLQLADGEGRFQPGEWPEEWRSIKEFLETMATREGGRGFRGGGGGMGFGGRGPGGPAYAGTAFEVPIFGGGGTPFGGRGSERGPGPRRGLAWMIFDVNPKYATENLVPELLQRELGTSGSSDYQFEVTPRGEPSDPIYRSASDRQTRFAANPDASVPIFDIPPDMLRPRGGRGGGGGRGPDGMRGPQGGRWELSVRHRAGSLETVVARTRQRNLAVTAGVLLLIIASAAALIRFTRRSQRLVELQMNFVAGVSHELRTPLTVINTAAFNLQGNVSRNPEQVAKYGALIRQESGRLKELVEQVLSFAGNKAGRIIQDPQPLAVEDLVNSSVESSRPVIESGHFVVEKNIAPSLPLVAGDPRALQAVIQNLLTNAVKYGGNGSGNWIGISVAEATEHGEPVIEIRVADHGPGIPAAEQRYIFDPFYRGKRALQDQVHGTGLGLTLVKDIVTAHKGSIAVHSQPEKGTEFVVRLPVAPREYQDEFANTSGRG